MQVGADGGIDPLLDDGDRLAGAVARDGSSAGTGEANLVDPVRVAELHGVTWPLKSGSSPAMVYVS